MLTVSRLREKNTITKIITRDDALDRELRRIRLVLAATAQRRREADAGDELDHGAPQHRRVHPDGPGQVLRHGAAEQQREPDQVHIEQHQPQTVHDRGS